MLGTIFKEIFKEILYIYMHKMTTTMTAAQNWRGNGQRGESSRTWKLGRGSIRTKEQVIRERSTARRENRPPVSSVGRVSDYRAGGLGFESQTGPTLLK